MIIKDGLEALMPQFEKFINTKTIVGEPIVIGNVTIVPFQAASFGFGSGGGEGGPGNLGGGAGGGASLRPVGILVVKDGEVHVYNLGKRGFIDKMMELMPEALAKIKAGKGKEAKDDECCCCEEPCDEEEKEHKE